MTRDDRELEQPLTYDDLVARGYYPDGRDGTAAAAAIPAPVDVLTTPVDTDGTDVPARRRRGPRVPDVQLVAPDIDELLAQPEPPYDWIVPGLFETGDRTILTGGEGVGKSTLSRQVALACAAGLHPFTLEPIEPVRVLLVDCENSTRHVVRQFRPLRAAVDDYRHGQLRVRIATGGMDLTRFDHVEHLVRIVDANTPQLIVAGPIYKMAGGDPNDEQNARTTTRVFDRIRAEHGCALFLEAHSPHATGSGARPTRPVGSSLWLRWPEFGVHLAADGTVQHWRGPRDERDWPARLARSDPWPFTIAAGPDLAAYEGPTHCIAAVVAHLEQNRGVDLSLSQLEKELRAKGLRYRHATFARAAEMAYERGLVECRRGARNALRYGIGLSDPPAELPREQATDAGDEVF